MEDPGAFISLSIEEETCTPCDEVINSIPLLIHHPRPDCIYCGEFVSPNGRPDVGTITVFKEVLIRSLLPDVRRVPGSLLSGNLPFCDNCTETLEKLTNMYRQFQVIQESFDDLRSDIFKSISKALIKSREGIDVPVVGEDKLFSYWRKRYGSSYPSISRDGEGENEDGYHDVNGSSSSLIIPFQDDGPVKVKEEPPSDFEDEDERVVRDNIRLLKSVHREKVNNNQKVLLRGRCPGRIKVVRKEKNGREKNVINDEVNNLVKKKVVVRKKNCHLHNETLTSEDNRAISFDDYDNQSLLSDDDSNLDHYEDDFIFPSTPDPEEMVKAEIEPRAYQKRNRVTRSRPEDDHMPLENMRGTIPRRPLLRAPPKVQKPEESRTNQATNVKNPKAKPKRTTRERNSVKKEGPEKDLPRPGSDVSDKRKDLKRKTAEEDVCPEKEDNSKPKRVRKTRKQIAPETDTIGSNDEDDETNFDDGNWEDLPLSKRIRKRVVKKTDDEDMEYVPDEENDNGLQEENDLPTVKEKPKRRRRKKTDQDLVAGQEGSDSQTVEEKPKRRRRKKTDQDLVARQEGSDSPTVDKKPKRSQRKKTDQDLNGEVQTKKPYKRQQIPCICDLCGKVLSGSWHLTLHLRIHNKDKRYPCEVEGCGKRFINNNHRVLHMRSAHTNERPYKCDVCGCRFSVRQVMKTHKAAKHGIYDCEAVFECNSCGKKVINEYLLKKHFKICERTASSEYGESFKINCNYCPGQVFEEGEGFSVHQTDETHQKIKQEKLEEARRETAERKKNSQEPEEETCQHCGEKFPDFRLLQVHNKKCHFTNEKVEKECLTCEICGKTFASRGSLKTHQIIHSDAKPFVCTEPNCGEMFNTKVSLSNHVENKHRLSFECSYCSKKFGKEKGFRRHLCLDHPEVHLRDRPNFCRGCFLNFGTEEEMEAHVDSQHKDVICDPCGGRIFSTKGEFKKHVEMYHLREGVIPRKRGRPRKDEKKFGNDTISAPRQNEEQGESNSSEMMYEQQQGQDHSHSTNPFTRIQDIWH